MIRVLKLNHLYVFLVFFLIMMIGDLKKAISEKTGLDPQEQKVLFRGKEKEDNEHLDVSGMKDKSKVLLLEELTNKEKKPEEVKDSPEKKHDYPKDSEEMRKALQAIAGVRAEVDKLSERVNFKGTLLMCYLYWLGSVEAYLASFIFAGCFLGGSCEWWDQGAERGIRYISRVAHEGAAKTGWYRSRR